jgi:hypothetical protein
MKKFKYDLFKRISMGDKSPPAGYRWLKVEDVFRATDMWVYDGKIEENYMYYNRESDIGCNIWGDFPEVRYNLDEKVWGGFVRKIGE